MAIDALKQGKERVYVHLPPMAGVHLDRLFDMIKFQCHLVDFMRQHCGRSYCAVIHLNNEVQKIVVRNYDVAREFNWSTFLEPGYDPERTAFFVDHFLIENRIDRQEQMLYTLQESACDASLSEDDRKIIEASIERKILHIDLLHRRHLEMCRASVTD